MNSDYLFAYGLHPIRNDESHESNAQEHKEKDSERGIDPSRRMHR